MAKKNIEVDERVVAIHSQMDEKVYEIRILDQEETELNALLEARVEEIKTSFANKVDKIGSRREQLKTELRTLFDQVQVKKLKHKQR